MPGRVSDMPSGFDASTAWLILVSMALGTVPRPAGGAGGKSDVVTLQK
jgi:hypothetical protein